MSVSSEDSTNSFPFLVGQRGSDRLRTPLSIYILWHPSFAHGADLARGIADWLSASTTDARQVGQGIPVYFRSADWRERPALDGKELPARPDSDDEVEQARIARRERYRRPINLDEAEHNVIVALVDDHMAADPSWRRDLIEVSRHHHETHPSMLGSSASMSRTARRRVHLIPVQLSAAFTRLPDVVTSVQAAFVNRWADSPDATDEARVERWKARLRSLLTQAIVRLLRADRALDLRIHGDQRESDSLLLTTVFLSHAKADRELGPGVAEQLRDVAASYGQIDVFYDENDLPTGTKWQDPLLGAARNGAGFIAVLSDRYATRYWCRREVEVARTPRRVRERSPGDSPCPEHHIFCVSPTVVTVTFQNEWSRLVADLGAAPVVAWSRDRATRILDRLFREAIVSEVQRLWARGLFQRLQELTGQSEPPIAFLTFTPDASSVLKLSRELGADVLLAYPGHGFLPMEEESLFGAAKGYVSFERLSDVVYSFARGEVASWKEVVSRVERLAQSAPETRHTHRPFGEWPVVALAAGDAEDLAELGYDQPEPSANTDSFHVDIAIMRFARTLLESHVRIVYGGIHGSLRRGRSFVDVLEDTVAATFAGQVQPKDTSDPDPATPLESYAAWPFFLELDPSVKAWSVGATQLHDVWPPAAPNNLLGARRDLGAKPSPQDVDPLDFACLRALSLSRMREQIARHSDITLMLAGKTWGAAGIMPGLAEELLAASEVTMGLCADGLMREEALSSPARRRAIRCEQVRLLLLGGFGGVSRQMAGFVLGRWEYPRCLTLQGQLERSSSLALILRAAPGAQAWLEWRYECLRELLAGLKAIAELPGHTRLPRLDISVETWRGLMITESPGFVRRTLRIHTAPKLWRGHMKLDYCMIISAPDALPLAGKARGAILKEKAWNVGETIRIKFVEHKSPALHARLKAAAQQWIDQTGINLAFQWVGDGEDADVRISFSAEGSWSTLGTDCRNFPNQATMNFGWLEDDTSQEELERVVIHEFGHMLGLIHEHQNPEVAINWDKDAVYADMAGKWSKAQIDHNLFRAYERSKVDTDGYDPLSIMHYPVPEKWTRDGSSVGRNTKLSKGDIELIRRFYT